MVTLNNSHSYDLFFKFIQTYSPKGFKGIDPADPLMVELEALMEKNNQFFFVGDIIKMQINYTSKRSFQMMGIEPDELTPYHFREGVHPDDAQRQGLGTTQLFKMAHQLFIDGKGEELLSINLQMRNSIGHYSNLLIQCYLFFLLTPYKTVYILQVHTDIDWIKKNKIGNHYYVGNDLSYFRYPDNDLLMIGNPFSSREFEIIRLIATGLNSEQIASKLFLSVHTVNTHRSNILEKTEKASIPELIYHLKESGLL
jgi:DNA-binding CsgD family transcriptional regulator